MLRYGLRIIVVILGLAAIVPAIRTHVAVASIPKEDRIPPQRTSPKKGTFLVAKRSMPDPRFRRTVILLLEHGDDGTLGLIINRPMDIPLSQALPDLDGIAKQKHFLFFGGPVAADRLIFLVRSDAQPQETAPVMADVYYSASKEALERAIRQRKGSQELRMFLGHSGWAGGQLEAELARGDWLVVQADPQTVFEQNPERIWPKLIEQDPGPGMIIDNRKRQTPAAALRITGVAGAVTH